MDYLYQACLQVLGRIITTVLSLISQDLLKQYRHEHPVSWSSGSRVFIGEHHEPLQGALFVPRNISGMAALLSPINLDKL